MRFASFLLFAACVGLAATYAQEQAPGSQAVVPVPLGFSSTLQIVASSNVIPTGGLFGNGRCDDYGNIYVRILDAVGSEKRRSNLYLPVQKILPDGRLGQIFSFSEALPDLKSYDFFVTGAGKVYMQARNPEKGTVYVLEFDTNGTLRPPILLDVGETVSSRQIVVFPSGELLVSGTSGEFFRKPFTAVFDAKGKLIKQINEPEDEYAKARAEAGDKDFIEEGMSTDNTSVVKGDAALGSDGNAYLLRATSPALIYVISPKGDVIRKLRIESPEPGLVARQLKSSHGKLAVIFLQRNSTAGITEIVDLRGQSLGRYFADDEHLNPGLPSCYDSQSFTFLSPDMVGGLKLYKAQPK